MKSNDIVLRVIETLESEGIGYMLVGSYSSNAYGIERSTQDADFVIELGDRSISAVASALLPEIVLDPQLSFESVTLTSRYIARRKDGDFKVELFLLADEPFATSRFARRTKRPFLGRETWLPSPEDVIVQKLRWYGKAKRSKDIEDARQVLVVQHGKLDYAYIRHWCDQHGTLDLFEKLYKQAEEFDSGAP